MFSITNKNRLKKESRPIPGIFTQSFKTAKFILFCQMSFICIYFFNLDQNKRIKGFMSVLVYYLNLGA